MLFAASYEGEWEKGMFHGQGRQVDAEGNVYEGEFKGGLKDGEGKMVYASGETYEGEMKVMVFYYRDHGDVMN